MDIDWHRILFSDHPYSFFLEILLRTPIIFLAVVMVLRLTGKRGVQQLSIFEMVMIITLGSAAGDSMFYDDVGMLHAVAVFVIVLVLYRLIIYIITKSEKAELLIEGKPVYLIKDGQFCLKELNNDELGSDEFFGELRQRSIEHLGQIKYAILEDNGKISVYYYPDDDVKPGLPILPEDYHQKNSVINNPGLYACSKCGSTFQQMVTTETHCVNCNHNEWVLAIDNKRIT
ncbi:uncharacterized membrane protein YcaP (DUF421 family) [Pedobacter sp. CAN_A7]|uniref:DUF421 domain-containing protein n=1 Tax=Pedobacter sp. CAN_A7 TaxID=2787722 RepID=UPI0018C93041